MYNRQFWNRVAGIAAGLSLAVYLFFNWVVYPAFVYQVKSVEALKRELHQQPGILVTEFGALQVSDKTYTVHLDGRNRVANKIGYDIDGRCSFLGMNAQIYIFCELRNETNTSFIGDSIVSYRGVSIGTSFHSTDWSAVQATVLLGDFMYRYRVLLPIKNAISEQRTAGTDIVITLSKELVDLYFDNNY